MAQQVRAARSGANADTEDLFLWLWDNLANDQAAVSSGRGASAAADWASGTKTIALPDLRSGVPYGLDNMGNSAASDFDSVSFTHGDATTGGSLIAGNTVTIAEANLPAHTHGVGTFAISTGGSHNHGVTDGGHSHSINDYRTTGTADTGGGTGIISSSGLSAFSSASATTGISIQSGGSHNHTLSGSSASVGSGTATNIAGKGTLGTWLIKL